MNKILLIEDEAGIAQMISVQLQLVGFKVDAAADTKSALQPERMKEADIIVLDWMLPDGEGPSLIPKIRQLTRAPILMLTARSEIMDKLVGFEAGADDYLTKPFDMMELIARIKALLRRATEHSPKPKNAPLHYGEIAMDLETRKVEAAGEEIELTPTKSYTGAVTPNEPVRVYDCSGPWGDPDFTGTSEEGLPPLRRDWILKRGDVEAHDGREVKPMDNGYLSGKHAEFASKAEKNRLVEFPGLLGHRRKPLRASKGHPVTQL
ncbi:MAG: response regulator, partial [candidate division KSB1 bacterium]